VIYEGRFMRPYSGLVFVVVVGVIVTPVLHRAMHKFHWEGEDEKP
jgi:hypothetical protein